MHHLEAQLVHDMRNAAAAIFGGAELLRTRSDRLGPGDTARLSEMIARRARVLLQLLEDVRVLDLIDQGELDVARTTIDCRTFLSTIATEQDTSKTVLSSAAPGAIAIADPVRLHQIIENLITNAVRYGGATISLDGSVDGHEVVLSVSDDGPGVPPALVESIFEEYARGETSGRHGGTGLGLSIVRQLTSTMGGHVAYRHDDGARFEVRLPRAVVASPASHRPEPAEGHTVTFWHDEAAFVEVLADFAFDGLCLGDAVVLAVTADHLAAVRASLQGRDVDVDRAIRLGQLVTIDAHQARNAITRDDVVDPAAFRLAVEGRLTPVLGGWLRTRVFGEIVDLFWRDGDVQGALDLESCWNTLRSHRSFSLLCGYQLDEATAARPTSLCECHDDVAA